MRQSLTIVLLLLQLIVKAQAWTNYSISNTPLPENSIRAIRFENDSTVWIGTDAGLAKFQSNSWTIYNTANSGLAWDDVRTILVDKNKTKWFGTFNGGLTSYDDTTWTTITTLNSLLPDDFVRSFLIDSNGTKWIGAGAGGGLSKVDSLNNWIIYQMFTSALASNNIASSYLDTATNDKYIGTVNGGLTIIHDDTTLTTFSIQTSGIPDNTILGITRDNAQNTWLASPANGLIVKLPGFGWFNYSPFNSNIASYALTCIDIDTNQDLWMGSTDMGLIRKSGAGYINFNSSNSDLTDNQVQCVRIARDGKIWLGTATKGVFVLDPSLLSGIYENKLLPNVNVFPNPATKGYTRIESGIQCESLIIFDLNGKEILSQKINASEASVDLRNINSGIYFLRIKMADGSVQAKKIVVSN